MKIQTLKLSIGSILVAFVLLAVLSEGSFINFAAAAGGLPGDLNSDNTVNATDLTLLTSAWGATSGAADINGDGKVNIVDMSLLLSSFGQTLGKPAIPTGLVATPGDSSVTLTWAANAIADRVDTYQVYLNDQNYNLSVANTNLTVTGLTNGTAYTFRVSAHNSAGYGDWTAAAVSSTPMTTSSNGTVSSSITNGQTLTGPVSWTATVSSGTVTAVDFYIDGTNDWEEGMSPYVFNGDGETLDSTTLANGSHVFKVVVTFSDNTTSTVSATATVSNTVSGGGGGGGSSSGNGIGLLALGSAYSGDSHGSSYNTVIISPGEESACNVAGPAHSLLYESGTDENTNESLGVPWSTANSNGWLLKDSGGSYLINQGFTNNYIGDVGSSGYQQAWISGVASALRADHCNGVFIDDTLQDIAPLTGEYPAKYPSQAAWATAMASFIAAVGPALKAQGFYVVPNAVGYISGDGSSNDGTADVNWYQRLGSSVSGLMDEFWQQIPTDYSLRPTGTDSWDHNWDGWQRLLTVSQNMGDDFVGLLYGSNSSDTQAMRYGKGSLLVDWNGGGSVFMYHNLNNDDDWNSSWTTSIGTPSGAKSSPQSGVWTRTYSGGKVILNTTQSAVTVSGHTVGGTDAYIGP